jgi:secondary thiamine-phosphate synthase enzyme
MIVQHEITLPAFSRGFHIITKHVVEKLGSLPEKGLLHVFIKHTSAGLTINENADPSVRVDFETVFNKLVPEAQPYYTHDDEGPDDMPAHIKSTLCGASVTVPITRGKLNLGTWQGIYLCEFRNSGGQRKLVVTVYS